MIVLRSDNFCISPKIKHSQILWWNLMNFIRVEVVLTRNVFKSIRNKEFSINLSFVIAYLTHIWKKKQNETIFFKVPLSTLRKRSFMPFSEPTRSGWFWIDYKILTTISRGKHKSQKKHLDPQFFEWGTGQSWCSLISPHYWLDWNQKSSATTSADFVGFIMPTFSIFFSNFSQFFSYFFQSNSKNFLSYRILFSAFNTKRNAQKY